MQPPDDSATTSSAEREGGFTTQHPIACFCFFASIAVLGVIRVIIGGIGAACGWVKDPPKSKRA